MHSLRYCKRPRPHTSCRESSRRPREPALRDRRQDRRCPHPSRPRKGFRRQPSHHPATFRQDGSQQPARSLSHRIRHHLRRLREFRSRFLPRRMKQPRQREGPPAFRITHERQPHPLSVLPDAVTDSRRTKQDDPQIKGQPGISAFSGSGSCPRGLRTASSCGSSRK